MHKLNLAASILNSTPILVKHADEDERLVLHQEILKLYLSKLKESIDTFVEDLLSTVTGNRDQLYSSILDYNDIVKRNVSSLILLYLMEKGVTYQDTRKGGGRRQDSRDSKDSIWFGLIQELVKTTTVKVRVITGGKPKEQINHIRLLQLV